MKKVFITGATSGIGWATALAFARAGHCELVLCGRRQEKLETLVKTLKTELGCAAKSLVFDVSKPEDIEKSRAQFPDEWSKIDVLINNAGLARGVDPLHAGNPSDWDEMIDTNVKGLLRITRALLPDMISRKSGFIVNLGSVAGRWTYPGGSVYCATKFAVRALSECLRMETLGQGIRVTNIEPGMVETEFSEVRFRDTEKAKQVYKGLKPLTADDVAKTIFWCTDQPEHVNIQELVIYPTAQASVTHVHRT